MKFVFDYFAFFLSLILLWQWVLIIYRKNELACNDPNVSKQNITRKKRNVDLPLGCAGKASIIQKSTGLIIEVEVVREPLDLTEFSAKVCKDAIDGYDILQLTAELKDYNGSKYGAKD